MSKKGIKLGDEIIDVTSKTSGVAIGKIEYLDGRVMWIVQPTTTDDNVRIETISVPDAYAKHKGPGVYPSTKPPMGFRARDEQ